MLDIVLFPQVVPSVRLSTSKSKIDQVFFFHIRLREAVNWFTFYVREVINESMCLCFPIKFVGVCVCRAANTVL